MRHILYDNLIRVPSRSSSPPSSSSIARNDPFTSPHWCIRVSPNHVTIPSQSRLFHLVVNRGHSDLVMHDFIYDLVSYKMILIHLIILISPAIIFWVRAFFIYRHFTPYMNPKNQTRRPHHQVPYLEGSF